MNQRAINPWTWQEPLGFSQAIDVTGAQRMLLSSLVERGARVLVVASGNHRADAHAFYEDAGYTFTGRRYKKLPSSSA